MENNKSQFQSESIMPCEKITVECAERATLEHIISLLNDLKKSVDGNGRPGLKEENILNTAFRVRWEKLTDGLVLKVAGFLLVQIVISVGIVMMILGGAK